MTHSEFRTRPAGRNRRRRQAPSRGTESGLQRFAREYGWWRVVAIPVLFALTVWVVVDVVRGGPEDADAGIATDGAAAGAGHHRDEAAGGKGGDRKAGPDPADAKSVDIAKNQLPAGGAFTERGSDTYREVGHPGQDVGEGAERTIRYSIEIEDGVDTAAYGGDDAVATLIDATLADPRGWTADNGFKFVHVASADEPDTRFRLSSLETTAEQCGEQIETETSCHTTITGESVVVLNEARWVRGATPFEGDVGSYRQYLVNHEFGHAIGYDAHQPCGADGELAPVMMQQTISLNNSQLHADSEPDVYPDDGAVCDTNPWPYPRPSNTDPHRPGSR